MMVIFSGGAGLKINGSVEVICSGDFKIKAASLTFEGPPNLSSGLPALPKSVLELADQYTSSQ
jgi:type VI secretion system secreted protein VgrG